MEYPRYGKFRFWDHKNAWCSMFFCIVLSIAALAVMLHLEQPLAAFGVACFFTGFAAAIFLRWVWFPCRECFSLCHAGIRVRNGRKVHTIALPPELLLIVTRASLLPARADVDTRKSPVLQGRYAVTLLLPMPLPEALQRLHPGVPAHSVPYSSALLSAFEPYQYLYSFVLQDDLLAQLGQLRTCTLILPSECSRKLPVPSGMRVYIDQN